MSHLQLWQRKQKIADAQIVPNAHDAARWLKSCTSWYLVDPIISWRCFIYMSSPTYFLNLVSPSLHPNILPGRNTPSCQFRATLAPLIRELLAKPSTCGKSYGAELFWSGFLLIASNETRKGFIVFMYVAVEMSKTCGSPHSGKGKLCIAMRATNKNKHHI